MEGVGGCDLLITNREREHQENSLVRAIRACFVSRLGIGTPPSLPPQAVGA